ncbi:MAG: FlaA1/EpsC-like NDP-sugar epimerase [Gammaproteobacteria bacterium]|jgi:FlaA1/EpsC-like NDP-sugar epimerase|tara:strand:- start:326 stop:2266 length:1941 start_codon:yes stop_codon:yes gene_type:complete
MQYYQSMRDFLIKLPRNIKRSIMISGDIMVVFLVFWLALMMRAGEVFWFNETYALTNARLEDLLLAYAILVIVAIPVFVYSRLYRSIIRYISLETYIKIIKATALSSLLSSLIMYYLILPVPRSVILIYFILLTGFMFFTRFIARSYLLDEKFRNQKNILIYGINDSSQKVSDILKNTKDFNISGFISKDIKLKKTSISEIPVFMVGDLEKIIDKLNINEIILIPENSGSIKNFITSDLNPYRSILRKIPDLNKIAKGIINEQDIQKIEIEDLLGREAVKPDPYLLKSCIDKKEVLITGCGGSIGSELTKQIILLNPKSLILVEQSEYFLYEIMQEISEIKKKYNLDLPVYSYQGSIGDKEFMSSVFKNNNIDTVYHAAANKHVPLVEQNPVAAIKTNILGTHNLAVISYKNNVENFVLISSDKAVRPTNIMGATKRFAEIILQSLQDLVDQMPPSVCRTKFCMVRFGNVLDTSGSVVPLFRRQIKHGGPVTVTDPKVIRYFMTIEEASELVIQAGSLSKGGDVFVLEMGRPVNILSLAKQMIELSGYEIKNEKNSLGDIEIEITGLREGEKLYEELLIGDNVNRTIHTHIMSATEEKLSYEEVSAYLEKFKEINSNTSKSDIKELLQDSIGASMTPRDNVVEIKK